MIEIHPAALKHILACATELQAMMQRGEVEDRQGKALFRQACAMNLEGIVSKRKGRLYRSGPSKDRLKIKCPEYRRS